MKEKYYDCAACQDKNCAICPGSGNSPNSRDISDSYRSSVKKGYYSSTIAPRYDENGKFIGYGYVKPGE